MLRFKYSGSTGIVACPGDKACAVLSAVPLNAAAASRTMLFNVRGYSTLKIQINYTYSAATVVIATPSCSQDNNTTYGSETSTGVISGTGTVSVYTDNYTTGAANAKIVLTYDTRGCDWYKVILSGTGAGAGDLVTTYAVAAVGQ